MVSTGILLPERLVPLEDERHLEQQGIHDRMVMLVCGCGEKRRELSMYSSVCRIGHPMRTPSLEKST
jgi:hypothetical protein